MSTNANLNEKKDRAARQAREDLTANRMFAAMGVAFVVLLVLAICRMQSVRIQAAVASFIVEGLFWVRLALGLLSAAAIAVCIVRAKKGTDESGRVFTFTMLAGVIVLFFVASLLFPTVFYTGLMVYFGAAFLLYAIYCIYHNGFFVFSLLMAVGALLIYAASLPSGANRLYDVIKIVSKILAIALPIAVGAVTLVLMRKKGTVNCGGKKVKLLSRDDYLPLLVAAAALLLGAVLILFFGGLLRPILMLLLAIFLVFTIMYTVKLV